MPCCVIPSPIGSWRILEEDGAIVAIDASPEAPIAPQTPLLQEAAHQLSAYFAGTLREFRLPLRLKGSAFQLQCWQALCAIPYGETISYGEQARRIGRPGAARAVGGANHRNPISIVIPCHRVIGANGALTGYGGGVDKKQWLLDHEKQILDTK